MSTGKATTAVDGGSVLSEELDRLMSMTEEQIDAELLSLGIDPAIAEEKGRAAVERALAAIRTAKSNCLKEWESVNDPPCHPNDRDWRPCADCLMSNVRGNAQGR